MHGHRVHTTDERCWTHCVTPDGCAARPERQRAHGSLVIIETCRCGAVRHVESNGGARNRGRWIGGAADES